MKKKTNNNFLIIDIVFAILTILVVISLFQNILLASFLLAIISAIYIYIKKSKNIEEIKPKYSDKIMEKLK